MNQQKTCKSRNTVQRTMILDTVNNMRLHPSADEVYELIATTHPTISRGTVYRNLNKLAEEGMIKKRIMPYGPDRFDHNTTDHYHVCCQNCGRVADISMTQLNSLVSSVEDSSGFKIDGYDLVFKGLCPECMK